jgi:hypothetical protein
MILRRVPITSDPQPGSTPDPEETMKRMRMLMLIAVAATLFASIAAAQNATPRVDRREARQHVRIAQGVRSGQLTPAEARRLRHGQRHIGRMERRAKADGVVTTRERRRMNQAQNHQSRAIRRLKHNERVR